MYPVGINRNPFSQKFKSNLSVFQIALYFEIVDRASNQLGLFERRGRSDFAYVRDKGDLRHDRLYYLYYREKPDKNLTLPPSSSAGASVGGGVSTTPSNSQSPVRGGLQGDEE